MEAIENCKSIILTNKELITSTLSGVGNEGLTSNILNIHIK
jgi:hypothetical protein